MNAAQRRKYNRAAPRVGDLVAFSGIFGWVKGDVVSDRWHGFHERAVRTERGDVVRRTVPQLILIQRGGK